MSPPLFFLEWWNLKLKWMLKIQNFEHTSWFQMSTSSIFYIFSHLYTNWLERTQEQFFDLTSYLCQQLEGFVDLVIVFTNVDVTMMGLKVFRK